MARWGSEKRAEVRARILEAARDEFAALGFEGTTMRDVAKASGIATGTLFNYFDDKTELLHAALADRLDSISRACIDTMPPEGSAFDTLAEHVAGCFFDYYMGRPALSRALLERSLFASGPAAERFRQQVESLGAVLVERATDLQRRGQLSPNASPERVVLAFFSHYYFVLQMGLSRDLTSDEMRAMIGRLATQLLEGVRR
ncbi:MAG: TetR/AcrR family transcriptional regulator [Myxococcota bacterium]